ncbi:MAG: ABC-F family ATP-binding cassette domain-containing protein [Nocardioidaceae bacterium]|nr:ABC-F family ATP-binding cassette domain-containing protein [Nocardioidaceae bacterium]
MSFLTSLVARDISKAYGDRLVLDGVDLVANPGQHLGLVGENGIGKSTLLRLLGGTESLDSGEISRPQDVGYLGQEPEFPAGATVADVLAEALAPLHESVRRLEQLACRIQEPGAAGDYDRALAWAQRHDAWDADRRAELALARLGLGRLPADRRVAEMSGGERTRLCLALLIGRKPDCLLLDEPTNHLDDEAMEFLERFLLDQPGVVVVASHDRVLLDRVCSVIVDLDPSHFGVDGEGGRRYRGGFTAYLRHKQRARQQWEEAFLRQQEELGRLRLAAATTARQVAHDRPPRDGDKFIYSFKGANVQATIRRRVREAEQRIQMLERSRVPEPPRPLAFDSPITSQPSSRARIHISDLRVDGRLRLDRLEVSAGEHLLVCGANGSGKSTLLGVLAGRLPADQGQVTVSGGRVELLPQHVRFSRPEISADRLFAAMVGEQGRNLGDVGLLHPRDLRQPVGVLSVGQQRRLALAVLVARQPDLLLLDEPTNSISLALASELESALERSPGTVVVASHDRWLRQRWSGSMYRLDVG